VGLLGTGYLFSKDGASDTSSKTHNPVGARFGY